MSDVLTIDSTVTALCGTVTRRSRTVGDAWEDN